MSETITEEPYWKSLQNYIINPPSHTFQNEMKWTERKNFFIVLNKFIFLKLTWCQKPIWTKKFSVLLFGKGTCVSHIFKICQKFKKLFFSLGQKNTSRKKFISTFWTFEIRKKLFNLWKIKGVCMSRTKLQTGVVTSKKWTYLRS